MFKNAILAIPLTTFNSASLMATYQPINASGFPVQLLDMNIVNDATTAITISFDGTHDNIFLRSNESITLSSRTISSTNPDPVKHPKGRVIYVKGTAGVGTIYLGGFYIQGT